ncbi:MAG TPA: N-acetyltransferase [Terriglobales bacterium]|nr:N-acetyltransferase [Terriglobales bacterium]
MLTREARLRDAVQIHDLIASYSGDGTLLPRTLPEICENIRDFVVVEDEGRILGCGALHLYGPHLAEVRSIAVVPDVKGKGAGRSLVEALLEQAAGQEVTCVCLFTRIPEFFARLGFEVAVKEAIPDKLYKDCLRCPRFHKCDEVAMVRGELPQFGILQPPTAQLVKLEC